MIHFSYFLKNPIRIFDAISSKIKMRQQKCVFAKNSKDVLFDVQRILQNKYTFYFDFGTLIGIYREGELLLRDMDIDLSVKIENLEQINELRGLLDSEGFSHKYRFMADGIGIIQDTYEYKGITVDVNYYRHNGEEDYCFLLYDEDGIQGKVLQWKCHHVKKMVSYDFKGIQVNIPDDPEQHLADRYGPSWRVPDPSYKYWNNPMAARIDVIGRIEIIR